MKDICVIVRLTDFAVVCT